MQPETLVRDHTVYACVMGSRAFGLATDTSDTDRRGVFLAPTPLFWRFEKPPTHVEGPGEEQFSWELERFCELALRGNPNILECLHSPLVEHVDDTGRELLALRGAFLSRRAYDTFTRYALGQRRKLDADVRTTGAPRWKHAMHLLRLLTSARDLLRTGELRIDVGDQREPLLAVKRGEVSWAEVETRMARLGTEAEEALHRSPLPPEPDTARVADFLFRTRRTSAHDSLPHATPTSPDPQEQARPRSPETCGVAGSGRQADADHEVVQGVVRGGGVRQE
ncbi:DNA polymerase beta superfamily protein [Streptomyces fodineus]|uniref:nucleotidyltransferase domain-containing protein n=1 Tax=Streptomyces fodineus TaxID=1904616 RepID=UPI0009A12D4C|nr:nucleotidyltransferase domain-containing protein [Streptomyces fodineus]